MIFGPSWFDLSFVILNSYCQSVTALLQSVSISSIIPIMSPHATELPTESELITNGMIHSIEQTAPSVANTSVVADLTNGLSNGATPNDNPKPALAELDASLLKITYTTSPRPVPKPSSPEVLSQTTCTDHMILCEWTASHGWHAPELKPYGPLSLMPTTSVLHYATTCFEGLKLYRGSDGALRLFRPALNAARMVQSAARIALPSFAPAQLLALVAALCAADGPKWLPATQPGAFLYVRPTLIGSDAALGVRRPAAATLFVVASLFPALDARPCGMRLLASGGDAVRAWPGGTGYAKVGANYGPTLCAGGEARARGFDQVLWLFGERGAVTEAGASNFFVVWRGRDGRVELVTAALDGRLILDGVTRRSVIEIAKERLSGEGGFGVEGVTVCEKEFTVDDIVEAQKEGRLLEAFICGTAYFLVGVSEIEYRGESIKPPVGEDGYGNYARLIKGWLKGIMYGKEKHEWGYVIKEQPAPNA